MTGAKGASSADQRVRKAAAISLAATVVVVLVKIGGAVLSGSVSVTAEALQSTLDIAMSALVLWAVKVSAQPPDEDHPFGHGRAELLAGGFQLLLALFVSAIIIWQAAPKLFAPAPIQPDWGVAAMAYAVVSNLAVIAFLSREARATGSVMLQSERAHLWSDTLASVGVIGGLLVFRWTGFGWIDPAVAIVFTAAGSVMVVVQLRRLLHPLMDGALPDEDLAKLRTVLEKHPDVMGFHAVRTRHTGRDRRVTLHVTLEDTLTFVKAHEVAEQVEDELSRALGGASVTIHYEPHRAEMAHRERHHPESGQGSRP